MPTLKDLLYKVPLVAMSGDAHRDIDHLCFDSRQARPGSAFVATVGSAADGHDYIATAIAQGAVAVVAQRPAAQDWPGVTYVQVQDSREALGQMAAHFYGHPSARLTLVGVTGTNGKTTTVTLLFRLFRSLGYACGLLSTVQNQINDTVVEATHTTPDPVQLQALLAQMVRVGCTHAFMEVSSHAVDQRRIAGLQFAGGVFSNISHDHLDYHKTFDAYIRAKKRFFDDLPAAAFALVNTDDRRGTVMVQNTRARRHTFALQHPADFKGKLLTNTLQGLEMELEGRPVWFQLIGDFNAYNLLSVYGVAVLLGEDADEVLRSLSELKPAAGRFDQLSLPGGVTAVIDYAHTPDALENVLRTLSELRTGNEQLITVIGCGGNRDRAKRPLMADIACKFSTRVLLTSDNPRDEDPEVIIREMQAGVGPADYKKTLSITDRREAIKTACTLAQPGDIILLAGKGHETYQEVRGVRHPFDDKQVLTETYRLLKS